MTQSQSATRTWRILDLINWSEEHLARKGVTNAKLETEWLLAHSLNLRRVDLYVQFERILEPDELAAYKALLKRRIAGEPFQYIIGMAPFYGRDFIVGPEVFIPRPETELLIQALGRGPDPASILDIGTGSGCLAITAALAYPLADVLAIDISSTPLEIAQTNATALEAGNVRFARLDILTELPERRFAAVLCNPPYITLDERDTLQPEVRDYEPPIALFDEGDGLTFHRRLAAVAQDLLIEGGQLIVEIGGNAQADGVLEIFREAGLDPQLNRDLQGDTRTVSGTLTAR